MVEHKPWLAILSFPLAAAIRLFIFRPPCSPSVFNPFFRSLAVFFAFGGIFRPWRAALAFFLAVWSAGAVPGWEKAK